MLDTPGARLKACREALGYRTAKQFSDTHGIPQATYINHENDRRGLRRAAAAKYGEIFRAEGIDAADDWLRLGKGMEPVGVIPPAPVRAPTRALRDGDDQRLTVDRALYAEVVEACESYLIDAGLDVLPARKGDLHLALYELVAAETGRAADDPVDISRYDNVIRLAC